MWHNQHSLPSSVSNVGITHGERFCVPSVTMSTASPQIHICQCHCCARDCSSYTDLYIFCGNDRKLGWKSMLRTSFFFSLIFSQGLKWANVESCIKYREQDLNHTPRVTFNLASLAKFSSASNQCNTCFGTLNVFVKV